MNPTTLTYEAAPPEEFSSPLDPGIADIVIALRAAGVETFESCQGGPGHSYPEPTVRFHGPRAAGFAALSAAMYVGLRVASLRRTWPILDGEPVGPYWEMTFVTPPGVAQSGSAPAGGRRFKSAQIWAQQNEEIEREREER